MSSAQQDQAVVNRAMGNVPDLVTSTVDQELSAGTIVVQVVDSARVPVREATGTPRRHGAVRRSREQDLPDRRERSVCSFDGLPTDTQHSYRVNVPYQGARYSSKPFRLDSGKGPASASRPLGDDDRRPTRLPGARAHDDRVPRRPRAHHAGCATRELGRRDLRLSRGRTQHSAAGRLQGVRGDGGDDESAAHRDRGRARDRPVPSPRVGSI